jgi:hypothetical protein
LGVSGAQFPYDVRYINKEFYMKVGGLDGLGPLLSRFGPEAEEYATVIERLNDTWYVVDRSASNAFGTDSSCSTDFSINLNENDLKTISRAYKNHPLFTIVSTSKEVVNGTNTTKFIVDPTSDAEAEAFLDEISSISYISNAKKCLGEDAEESFGDEEIVPNTDSLTEGNIAFYVTEDKQIKKLELSGEDDTSKFSMSGLFDYRPVTVSVPEGAKPIQELLFNLYGGLGEL